MCTCRSFCIMRHDLCYIFEFQEMYKYLVKHHKKPAKTDIRNKANLTPLTLASKLGRQKIFKEMLELNSLVSKPKKIKGGVKN